MSNFEAALSYVKAGGKATRNGWNGDDQFIFLVDGSTFEVNREPLLGIFGAGTLINYHPHIDMKLVDGSIVPWLASQGDLLATDWVLF